nr:amidohydrolase family protein [Streptomyces sp. SID5464]
MKAASGTAVTGSLVTSPPARALGPAPTPVVAADGVPVRLRFTSVTNGMATATHGGDRIVAEVQNILWTVPRDGTAATPLTPPDLEPSRPAFSPDGRKVAMSAYRGGTFSIWVMDADGSGLRRLTDGPFDDRAPAWSPDGRTIAFCSERGGDPVAGSPYRIWAVSVADGVLRQLTGVPEQQGPGLDGVWEDFDPVWSHDGTRVLFVRAEVAASGLTARTIASVAATGGPVIAEHTTTIGNLLAPAISPAGRIAWLRSIPGPPKTEAIALFAEGREVVLDGEIAPAPPRWIDDERLLLTVGGRFRMIRPHRDHIGEEIPLNATLEVQRPRYAVKEYMLEAEQSRPVRGVHLPHLSPDGQSIAFAALNSLWVVSVRGGTPRKVMESSPTAYVQGPVWSPDGHALIFTDDRDGLNTVRRREQNDGRETVLAPDGRVHAALSPDGTRLACLDMAGNLVVKDLAAGGEKVLAAPLGGGGLPSRPSWSPDGRYLSLCDRNRLNNRFREGLNLIRVVDTDSGASRLYGLAPHVSLSDRYASGPVWSPDGHWLACVSESALWLLPVGPDGAPNGPAQALTDEPADHPSWAGDSRTLLYQSNGRLRLLTIDASGSPSGAPRTVPVTLTYRRPTPVDTVVHAGLLWDGTGSEPRADVDILISKGLVTAVEPHRPGRPAARHVDASDGTVLPGLWDSHIHPWQYTYGARQGALQLAYGITTTVSLGGFAYEQTRLRDDIAAGRLAAPRLLATGELLDGSRVGYSMGRAHRTREGLIRSLARAAALDWDFVKTYVRSPYSQMEEAARHAHERLGVLSGGHLCAQGLLAGQDLTTHLLATERAEYGHGATAEGHTHQDTLEIYTRGDFHLIATPFTAMPLIGLHPEVADDARVTTMMPSWDIAVVEGLAARRPTADELTVLEREVDVYRRVVHDGGRLLLGTDAPLSPVGLHLHVAMRALHRYGMSPAEVLTTVTRAPASVFGVADRLGTVEPGKLADLTIVDGNPFENFDSLIRIRGAVRGGRLHERAVLEQAFSHSVAHAAPRGGWATVSDQMIRDGCCEGHHRF